MRAKISYLNHSGFIIETADFVAVFDLFTDPAGILASYTDCGKQVVFFVSHSHYDHWNSGILSFSNTLPSIYILDSSCRSTEIDEAVAELGGRVFYVDPYARLDEEELTVPGLYTVETFGSTDEGVSLLLDSKIGRLYHAGDLNDWDWQDEDSMAVEQAYRRELGLVKDALRGDEVQVAFVPVDARLAETALSGAMILLEYFLPRYLIPMHLNGGEDLPGTLRRTLRTNVAYDGTHVVTMTIPGMPQEI